MDYKYEIDPDELPDFREKLMKCKIIVLNGMDKHPLQNPKYFSQQDKKELLKKVRDLFDTKTIEEITEDFNAICNERLFDAGIDYSNFPLYVDKRFPNQQQKIDDEEPALNQLKEDIKENKLIVQDVGGNILEIDKQ